MITEPDTLTIDNRHYPLLKLAGGRVRWEVVPVETQPGDGGIAKPHTLYWHGGMGVSRRYSAGPQGGQGHHDFSENMWLGTDGVIQVAPRITFLDVSGKSATGTAFRLGGFKRSRLGGATTAGLGGGQYVDVPQWMERFGDVALYVMAGTHTYKINPAALDTLSDFALNTLDNLVGHWPLGEASGDALDGSTNSNDGTVTIGVGLRDQPALDADGDGSILFDSADTKVQIPDDAAIQNIFDGGGSVFFMFDADSPGESSAGTVINKSAYQLRLDGSGAFVGVQFFNQFSGNVGGWATALDLPEDTTIIGVLTFNADSANNVPILYIWDGTAFTIRTVGGGLTQTDTPVGTRTTDVGSDVVIGNNAASSLTFDGHLDEIMLFSDVLTTKEAQELIDIARGLFSTPTHEETQNHGVGARARSGDVFGNQLVVALGDGVDVEVATSPDDVTVWNTAPGVQRSVYRVGSSGRLFSTKGNRVFAVNEGQDPTNINNYVPTAGEPISDETDPIVGLAEWQRGLVAGHSRGARTLDPDSGFIDRPLVPRSRLSPSDYDGRAILTAGPLLLFAQTRAVSLFAPGRLPVNSGLELLEQNESPFVGPEYGIPDWAGVGFWPVFFSETGDSVIFHVRERKEGEAGIGPLRWMPFLFLENIECRVAGYWGGTATRKPRLFFGGSTVANPEIVGWVDLGEQGGDADIFSSNAVPALTGVVFGPDDDFGLPNTIKEVERLEMPEVLGADGSNFGTWSVSDDGGATFKDLLVDPDTSAGGAFIDNNGPQTVFASVNEPPSGRKLKVRLDITQASGATTFFQIRGYPTIYLSERPLLADQVTTVLDIREVRDVEDAEARVARLKALVGKKVQVEGDPGHDKPLVRIISVKTVTVEVSDASGRGSTEREATEVTFREVAVGT